VPFEHFTAALESTLPRYNASVLDGAQTFAEAVAALDALYAGSDFAIFSTWNHMRILALHQSSERGTEQAVKRAHHADAKVKRYEIGNPLFAVEMTALDVRAGQYAPVTVLVWGRERDGAQAGQEETVVEYDWMQDLVGETCGGRTDVRELARAVDEKRVTILERIYQKALETQQSAPP
jgi:hypothetical protein